MKIGFFDLIGFAYDHQLVEKKAIGGTQALAATLAYYLAQSGTSVTFYTLGDHRYCLEGVNYIGVSHPIEPLDIAVMVGLPKQQVITNLKQALGASRLVLWWHSNQLGEDDCQWISKDFDDVVVVSAYAFKKNEGRLPARKLHLIRNFIPLLPGLFAEHERVIPQTEKKSGCLTYVGNITRGLENIPDIASRLRERNIEFSIRIFSGTRLYYPNASDDDEEPEYIQRCRADPNVEFIKKVGKRDLFSQLRDVSVLLAPNTFNESFCLSLIEAMYMQLLCVATDRAAIPETAGGFAYLSAVQDPQTNEKFSTIDIDGYVELLCEVLRNPAPQNRLAEQKSYVRDAFSPDVAVKAWQKLFAVENTQFDKQTSSTRSA